MLFHKKYLQNEIEDVIVLLKRSGAEVLAISDHKSIPFPQMWGRDISFCNYDQLPK